MRNRPEPPQGIEVFMERLDAIDRDYRELREQTRRRLQAILQELSGRDFASLRLKQGVAGKIRQLLRQADLRLACPTCQQPAYLKAAAAGNAKQGLFQFDHSSGGARTTHKGSSLFPSHLHVIDAPKDKRLKRAAKPQSNR